MKKKLGIFALLAALALPISISAKTITADTTLTEDVNDGILVERGNVTLNLGGRNITNEAGKDTIKVEKGASLTIIGNGEVTNTSNKTAVLSNDGTLIIKSGTYSRVETETAKYYVLINHGDVTIDGGTFKTDSKGINSSKTSSLIDNGWYTPEKNTDKIMSNLTINGGKFLMENNNKYIKNDDFGVMTINGGEFTIKEPASAVIGNMGYASGKETVTVNGGTFNYTGSNYVILDYHWGDDDNSKTVINGGLYYLDNINANMTNANYDRSLIHSVDGSALHFAYAKKEEVKEIVKTSEIKEENIDNETLSLIKDSIKDKYTIAGIYEINLYQGLNDNMIFVEDQIYEADSAKLITLKVPSTIKAVENGYKRTYYVVRVHNGKADILNTTLNEDGTVSFKTDKFSTYSLVYVDTKEEVKSEVKNPNTADNAGLYFVLALVGLGVAGLTTRSLAKHH